MEQNFEMEQKCRNRTEISRLNKNDKFDHMEIEQKCRNSTKMLKSKLKLYKSVDIEGNKNVKIEQKC